MFTKLYFMYCVGKTTNNVYIKLDLSRPRRGKREAGDPAIDFKYI